MIIYNARQSQISIPLTATEKIVVPGYGTSMSFMPNPKILSLIVTSFDYSDIALIVSGPIEMTMCSETPCCAGFVASSLEEALERFDTPTTASMKCAAKIIDPINEERLEEERKAEISAIQEEAPAVVEFSEEKIAEEEPAAPVVEEEEPKTKRRTKKNK